MNLDEWIFSGVFLLLLILPILFLLLDDPGLPPTIEVVSCHMEPKIIDTFQWDSTHTKGHATKIDGAVCERRWEWA